MATQGVQPNTNNEALLMQQNNDLFKENYQRSQNEQALFTEWLKVSNEKKQLNDMIVQMQSHINKLETQIEKLLSSLSSPDRSHEKTPPRDVEYGTDEEELAKETEWIRVRDRRKKREKKMDDSLTSPITHEINERASKPTPKVKKNQFPPPIVVEGIKEYDKLYQLVTQQINQDKFTTKIVNKKRENTIINAVDEDTYRSVTKILREQTSYKWFTYEEGGVSFVYHNIPFFVVYF